MKISETELNQRIDRIIHAAFRLFCQDGIDHVSIKDVAREAGVGEKSIYRYFRCKTELVTNTTAVLWKEIVSEMLASLADGYEERSGLDQIWCLLHCMRTLFDNHANYVYFSYESKIFLAGNKTKVSEALYTEELRPIKERYFAALEKGMADGSIAARGEVEDIYYTVWGMMRGYVAKIVIYDRMYDGENEWRARFDTACAVIVAGLAHGLPEQAL